MRGISYTRAERDLIHHHWSNGKNAVDIFEFVFKSDAQSASLSHIQKLIQNFESGDGFAEIYAAGPLPRHLMRACSSIVQATSQSE